MYEITKENAGQEIIIAFNNEYRIITLNQTGDPDSEDEDYILTYNGGVLG